MSLLFHNLNENEVTIIGTLIYYIFMKKFFGLLFGYRTFENELFKWLGSNWSFPRFTKKQITNVVTTKTWKHDQLVGIMRRLHGTWNIWELQNSKWRMQIHFQYLNFKTFPMIHCVCSIWTMFTIYILSKRL